MVLAHSKKTYSNGTQRGSETCQVKWIVLTSLLLFLQVSVYAQVNNSKAVNISFANGKRLEYLLAAGIFSMYVGDKKVITNAHAEVKVNDSIYKSSGYKNATYKKAQFIDKIGRGIRYEFVLHQAGKPTLTQIFYAYTDKEFILTKVVVSGMQLSTNYMAVLVSEASLLTNSDIVNLYVPFDNDTFIKYNAKSTASGISNTSAEVGAIYDNTSREGLIVGSVEQDVWKTGIKTSGAGNKLTQLKIWNGFTEPSITRDTIPHGTVKGNTVQSSTVLIGYFKDWRNGLETYGKTVRAFEKPYVYNWTKPTPFGWNSWGVIQEHLTYDKISSVASFFKDSVPAFRNGNTAYIDLDSYWDKLAKNGIMGDLSALKEFANTCKQKGLEPGIYWAPFVDWGWNQQGSGNRKVEGTSNYNYADLWTKTGSHYHNIDGARALDPTHPGTRQRIHLYLSKFRECGFKMIKIDFLGHAAVEADSFYDKRTTTGMQAYKRGMEFLVDEAGKEMLIYAAISPSVATGRYVHSRRIACDAFKSISDTRYTLNSVNYGWWQTFIYNFIDADHIVFGNETPGTNRARLVSGLITGTFITGDDYSVAGPWQQAAKMYLQDTALLQLPKNGIAFMPLDGNSADSINPVFQRVIGNNMYVAVVNTTSANKALTIDCSKLNLNHSTAYKAEELFSHTKSTVQQSLQVSLPAQDAAIYKIRL